jgi:hypothetical protein
MKTENVEEKSVKIENTGAGGGKFVWGNSIGFLREGCFFW